MTGPWFRKWMGFGYLPITRQGGVVLAAMFLTCVPFATLFVMLADRNPAASRACAVFAAISALIGHATVVWKLDRTYGR